MAKRNLRTDAQLVKEGYFHVQTKRCSYHPCTAQIEVWRTPKGKLMPFDRLMLSKDEAIARGLDPGPGNASLAVTEPHFGSCKGIASRQQATKEGRHQEQEPEPPEER
jgi:hypothetical protein